MKNQFYPSSYLFVILSSLIFFTNMPVNAQPGYGTTSFATTTTIPIAITGDCTGGKHGTSAGFSFSIYSSVNCALNNATGTGSDGHINLFATPTTAVWIEGRIASSNASYFQLDNFVFSVLTTPFVGKTITVTGYKDGIAVPGAIAVSPVIAATGLTNSITVDVSSNISFDNINEFRLTPSGTDAQGTMNIQSITISAAVNSLPVNFLDISAVFRHNNIVVNFSTADEIDLLDYSVQISKDGTEFTSVHNLPAKNGSQNQYETVLPDQNSDVWIRIRSNESDGTGQYSRTLFLKYSGNKTTSLIAYPNPVNNEVFIEGRENQSFTISSLQGKLMLSGKIINRKINLNSLQKGVYILKVGHQTAKLFKN